MYSCLLYNGDKEDDDDEKPKNESKIRRISPLLKNSLKRSPMCKRFNCREKKLGDIKKCFCGGILACIEETVETIFSPQSISTEVGDVL